MLNLFQVCDFRTEPAIVTTSSASFSGAGPVITNHVSIIAWVMIFVSIIPVTCYIF